MGLLPATPPPGPFRPGFWRSPLRGPWLTSILGSLLLVGVTIVAGTGFASHAAYNPDLGRNALIDTGLDLPLTFDWPTHPAWLFGATQGLHVILGMAVVPLLLAKLWSVIPRLFAWPPVTSPAQAVERVAVALLVSSTIFQFATGILNAQYWYAFGFGFVTAHYYGAVVFVAALAAHLVVKLPVVVRAYRERGVLKPLRDDLARTRPEPRDAGGLVAESPAPPTISRRGLLAFAGAGSAAILVTGAGQSVGGPLRRLAVLAPRGGDPGFPVNKTASVAGIEPVMTGAGYRLAVAAGDTELRLSREDLLALPQRTETLPIACVEGWTATREWTGVPLAALAEMAGVPPGELLVESLQKAGAFRAVTLSRDQVANPRSLLALGVEGAPLSLDHGYPARIIVPALPGVHCTKWVGALRFS